MEASRAALLAGAHKIATVQTIATFDELKSVDSSVISLINAYTRLAALDLLHDPAEVSLRHLYSSQSANKRVTGLILEQQIQALDRSHHKPESKAAIDHLTAELLELYDAKADPIPRARSALCPSAFMTHLLKLASGYCLNICNALKIP